MSAAPSEPIPLPDKPGIWSYEYLVSDSKGAARQLGMTTAEGAAFKPKLNY